MLFQIATVLPLMAGTCIAAVCTGSSQREEGDVYSVYPASRAVWETGPVFEMPGNRLDCANICHAYENCFGFEHAGGNCKIFDTTPIGLKWGSVDVGIPHYGCSAGWNLNNWSQGFKGGQCCDVWMN